MSAGLILPIVLSTLAVFMASFLAWMVVPLHKKDWRKMKGEDDFLAALRGLDLSPGGYMFPGCDSPEEMKGDAYKQKMESGPSGVLTVFPKTAMGRNLGLTAAYFLVVNFCLAYLTTLAHEPGAEFRDIFRFVTTAAFLVHLGAIVQHSIWFRNRVRGHIVESIAYALITGGIFAALWP